MILELLILLFLPIEIQTQTESFPENIEYCQNVYWSWENPLNENCDFDQVERSLSINF